MSGSDIARLRAGFSGRVLTRPDPDWDEVRTPWNLAADRDPALIAQPATPDDVASVLHYARAEGLRVAPQATGHNAGSLGPAGYQADLVLLDTSQMRGAAIDPGAPGGPAATVAAGTQWGEVTAAADPYGLFPLCGSAAGVGVTGYTLGGGLSFLGRKHGLAANHVRRLQAVTPDGRVVRADAGENPDLFWALRGGGANFGVVTEAEFSLFGYGQVTAGMFVWPYERHAEVLEAWHVWTLTAPEDISTSLRIIHLPPLELLPPFLRGQSAVIVDGVFAGDPASARAALASLRELKPEADTWAAASPAALDGLHLDPPDPVPALSTSMLLGSLDAGALHRFAAAVPPGGPVMFGELRHLGGALRRTPDGAGATGCLRGEYLLDAVGVGTEDGTPALRPALDALDHALAGSAAGLRFANFTEQPTIPARDLFADADYARLLRIRAAIDPGDLMRAAHRVPLPDAPDGPRC